MKKIFSLILTLTMIKGELLAQNAPVFTADSIESGNSKDILTNFFQLAFNNLTGNNREFNFSASPYAIMLKRNENLSIDKEYKRLRPWRKTNISLGIKLDSSFYFNGFSSGIKYALIDKTDITVSSTFADKARADVLNQQRDKLTKEFGKYLRDKKIPLDTRLKHRDIYGRLVTRTFSTIEDDGFKEVMMQIIKDNNLNEVQDVFENKTDSTFESIDIAKFEAIKNSMKNNLLWTIGISDTTYKDKFQFSHIALTTEISKGIFDPRPGDNNIEFTAKAAYNFLNDSLRKDRNLKREIFTTEAGFNWIIRDRSTEKSFLEAKFTGTFYHNFASLYNGENRDSLTLNGTIRFRLIDDIWIPLEVKYDPKSGNVFGFLNIKANLTGLNKLKEKLSGKL